MVNLAPVRYPHSLAIKGGPIDKIIYGSTHIEDQKFSQASAWLLPHLKESKMPSSVAGTPDGTGTHTSAMVARYMAISEALERWALHAMDGEDDSPLYGFDRDSTSTGMAAYPGLFTSSARRRARREAIERFCLVHWWNGQLGTEPMPLPFNGGHGFRINNPLSKDAVVVTWQANEEGWTAYGFAAAGKPDDAAWKAAIEMDRAQIMLKVFQSTHPEFSEKELSSIDNYMERRMMTYALPSGHAKFLQRIDTPSTGWERKKISPIIDREIPGPWSKYATVWRVLYPTDSDDHLNPEWDCFYW